MRHRTLEFKSQKIERKVTESQKIVRTSLAKYEKTSLSLDPKSPNFFASMLIVIFCLKLKVLKAIEELLDNVWSSMQSRLNSSRTFSPKHTEVFLSVARKSDSNILEAKDLKAGSQNRTRDQKDNLERLTLRWAKERKYEL